VDFAQGNGTDYPDAYAKVTSVSGEQRVAAKVGYFTSGGILQGGVTCRSEWLGTSPIVTFQVCVLQTTMIAWDPKTWKNSVEKEICGPKVNVPSYQWGY
jgi:hypothetical protein